MSFDAAWLDLREPADHAARDRAALTAATEWLGDGAGVDLGCGTGSTLRAFGDAARPKRWLLVDNDPALLSAAAARGKGAGVAAADLRDVEGLPLAGARLVTASALCDLVSRAWLDALADRLAAVGAGFYAALNYDGEMTWTPALPDDVAVVAAFNAHQRGDKGFGPALGPASGTAVEDVFGRRGFAVRSASSPWRLGPPSAALQRALVEGIAGAAAEAGLERRRATAWAQARRAASETALCTVGHRDVFATPGAPSAQSKITSVSRP